MSETWRLLLKLIWVRRLKQSLDRYDWDAKPTIDTDMTETPRPELAQIWLRRPKNFCSCILILHTWDCVRIKNDDEIFFGRLSHICASSGRGVSVKSVSTVGFASQSYRSKLYFKRLTHIGFILYVILVMLCDTIKRFISLEKHPSSATLSPSVRDELTGIELTISNSKLTLPSLRVVW